MEAILIANKPLVKCGVFRSQLDAEIEALQLHLVITTCGYNAIVTGKAYFWTVVLTMVRVICFEIIKVQVEWETAYVSYTPALVVGQYLWGTLQSHRVMDNFLQTQF